MCTVNVKAVIHFEDPMVKKILVKNYDLDGDGEISYTEAKRVTSIPFPMFTAMPITTFDELKYFTNLVAAELEYYIGFGKEIFKNCPSLDRIIVPAEFIDEYLNAINWGMLNEEEYLYYSYIIEECFDYTFDFFLS